jgi:serine/threonine protein kinase
MTAGEHRLALPAGYELGKYVFQRVLGAGGFGITYLAEDKSLGRRVAIKELLPGEIATRVDASTVVAKTQSEEDSLEWARDRFLQEGRALAACEHPNVVHVYEMLGANGTAYMVTKFEDGRSFGKWLTDLGRAPTEKELVPILVPLLSGLEKVHKAGFLHRDLKPENIYITDDGRPVLLDFGSARQAISDRTNSMTSIVSAGYAPLEQYHDDGKQGAWTDIYALAAVMYRAIDGHKPPEATRRLKDDPCLKLAQAHAGQYSDAFLRAIDRGLAFEPAERPQSIAEWRQQSGLDTVVPDPVTVPTPPPLSSGTSLSPPPPLSSPPAPTRPRLNELPAKLRASLQWAAGVAIAVLAIGWLIWKVAQPGPNPRLQPEPIAGPTPKPLAGESTPRPATPAGTPPVEVAVVATPPPSTPPFGESPVPGTPPGPGIRPTPGPGGITPAAARPLDAKLIGIWSTKMPTPNGFMVVHWEQSPDGHYTASFADSKEVIDSGTLSATGGVMHRFSQVTQQTVDLKYKFKGSKELVTTEQNDPTGPKTWHKVGESSTASREKSTTHSRGSSGSESGSHGGESGSHVTVPDFRRYIPRGFHF